MKKWLARLWMGIAATGMLLSLAQAAEIRIEGSQAMLALSQTTATGFRKTVEGKAVELYVGAAGSRQGMSKLCAGLIDIAVSARPASMSEAELCAGAGVDFIELPIAFDALVLIVNERNTYTKSLTLDELRKIWGGSSQGQVTRWNQVNPAWPETAMTLIAPDNQSSDASYFYAAVLGGKLPREDVMLSDGDDIRMQGVRRSAYALSFVSLGNYLKQRNQLHAVSIASNDKSPPVEPTLETIKSGLYQPLTRPLFLYVSTQSLARPEVNHYLEYLLTHITQSGLERHYALLDSFAYQRLSTRIKNRIKGSLWHGTVPVGMKINEIQAKYGLN